MPPSPLATIPSSSSQKQQVDLSNIPSPKDFALSSIQQPSSLKLDEIRMPPEGSKIKIPKSKAELIELVAANGDGYEEILVTKCNNDDFDPQLK